jgi:hypothetical protein
MQDVRPRILSARVRGVAPAALVGAGAMAVTAVILVVRAPAAVRDVDNQAIELAALPESQRELVGARSADVDTRVFVDARRLIARDETFAVVTGANVQVSSANTTAAVVPFARYYLFPRRQVDPSVADWLLSFGGDPDSLGLQFSQRLSIAPGIELLQVAR